MRDGLVGNVLHHANTDGVVELVHSGGVVRSFARAPRSRTRTEREVRPVISLAIARPVQPPPTINTFTGLSLFISCHPYPIIQQ